MVAADMNKAAFVQNFMRIVLLVQENWKIKLGICRNHVNLSLSYQLVIWSSCLCEVVNLQLYMVHLTTDMYCYLVTQTLHL